MDVCFIFRQSRPSLFSIEKVFKQIIESVEKTFSTREVHVPHSRLRFFNILENIRSVKNLKASVYHITGDVHYLAMAFPKKKSIVTIHDCVFIEDSVGAKQKILKFFFLDWPVKHASFITTISQKSKQEIIKYTGCAEEKIHVIHNPVSSTIFYKPQAFNSKQPVILFLGTKDHKNLSRAISALNKINCHLDIIGPLTTETKFLLTANNISYSQSANISEEAIADKYAGADIILFPSLYEGFGLPIIEGNKAGRVVITSNISPMNEIAADAACLVDPTDVTSISNGLLKVISDASYRTLLIENGFKNIERFQPDFIAQQYISLYKKIL